MADQFGALALPHPEPGPDDVVTDPFLRYTLSFFQAFINAKASAAWAKTDKAPLQFPVKTVQAFDPTDLSFVLRELPTLYMWRQESDDDASFWLAEDILVSHEQVSVLWVMPPADEEKQKKRVQFANGIRKDLIVAIELGRDPSWVVPGDTDPQAVTYGSVFPRWAGWSRLHLSKWQRKTLIIENHEANERYPFQAFEARMTLEEVFDQDLTKYDLLDGVDQTETTEDGQVVTDHALFQ